jgi:hypothetical protein
MTVMLAYPTTGWPRHEFMEGVIAALITSPGLITECYGLLGGTVLGAARNEIAEKFLATACDWLWCVDSDIVITGGTLPALLAAADPEAAPIVSALYQLRVRGHTHPAMYGAAAHNDGGITFTPYATWPEDTLLPVAGCGAGCLLIHRSVFKRISEAEPADDHLWFANITIGHRQFGEDLSFCLRAVSAGVPLHAHTGIQVGHMKTVQLGPASP